MLFKEIAMFKTSFYLLILMLGILAGCINEDTEYCPQPRLTFRYTADGSENVLPNYLHGSILYVFDKNGQYVTQLKLSATDLANPQGMILPLPPGDYRLVCWGNAASNTEIIQGKILETFILQAPGYSSGSSLSTHDPLYYASSLLHVGDNSEGNSELRFESAHINLEIYIKGFENLSRATSTPVVSVHNLTPQYDFRMKGIHPYTSTYTPTTTADTEKKVHVARLSVLRFTDDNPIEIEINDSRTGNSLYKFKLKEFMAAQQPPIQIGTKQEVTIPVLVSFEGTGLNITVTTPVWEGQDINPGI